VFKHDYATLFPETYDPLVPEDLVYSGGHSFTDQTDNLPINVGKLVLSSTRTYAPVLIPVINEFRHKIDGIVHCSGGAQTKVLHFIDDLHVTKDNLFATPPLFEIIQKQSGTSWEEMYKVFNMGHRMEIYTDEITAKEVISISQSFGVPAQIVGRVEKATRKQVTVKSAHGIFNYH
jgi:phosphoribosylformylglycinamidine cyclo-ligase